ncbi:MFS transporter [Streptomonospora wellingtoniae]|uniref:MFS transporter n=1 Tax=Streptomonospora wellingtoniae TaxID=3075544 RepID=A0ABU2KNS8_9ACTN|nr:MFS transporter [Streptomonospora sp. DSM 45055]MDT0300931.1 MFS transporter [Streptomonospora sp. DSM 45055]
MDHSGTRAGGVGRPPRIATARPRRCRLPTSTEESFLPALRKPASTTPADAPRAASPPHPVLLVALSGTVLALSGPGQTAGISVFVDHIIADIGISRSAVSTAYMVGTLSGAVALPWIGRAVDRFGVRPVLACVALAFGAFLLLLAAAGELASLTAAFVGARAMGQGGMTMIATTAVGIAVTRNRGTALGITGAVGAAGISLFPLLAERLIALLGWRHALLAEALLVWAVVLPIAWWGMRGVRNASAARAESGARADAAAAWPLRAVVRTSMFWTISGAVACSGLVTTAVFFHQVALLGEQGLTPTQAAANFLPQTVAGLLASMAFSSATDRFSPKLLIAASMAVHALTLALLPFVAPGVSAMAYGATLGAAAAGARAVEAAAFPYYYGTATLGTLRGLTQSIAVASTAVGPLLLSLGHDATGSYQPVVLAMAALPAAIDLAAPFARRPRTADAAAPAQGPGEQEAAEPAEAALRE